MRDHIQTELLRSAPAASGAVIYGLTLSDIVGYATLGYIVLQTAYLIWKWRREARRGK